MREEKSIEETSIDDELTIALVVVDANRKIRRCNERFTQWFSPQDPVGVIGQDFYRTLKYPFFFDGCFAPFHFAEELFREYRDSSAPRSASPAAEIKTILTYKEKDGFSPENNEIAASTPFYEMTTTPIARQSELFYLVELKDITGARRYEKMLHTLQEAGEELTSIIESSDGPVDDALIKSIKEVVLKHMKNTLNMAYFEIRILDKDANLLYPFIYDGFPKEAAERTLRVGANGNGITGYVADSREAYICADTKNDPLYMEGAANALSSLTVPLIHNNEVVGVCNVEHTEPNAFLKRDSTFLQLFGRDLAYVIHFIQHSQKQRQSERQRCANAILLKVKPELDDVLESASEMRASSDSQNSPEFVDFVKNWRRMSDCFTSLLHAYLSSPDEEPALEKDVVAFSPREVVDEALAKYLNRAKCLIIAPYEKRPLCFDMWLQQLGCAVDVVSSSKTALHLIEQIDYDLVVCDLFCDGRYFSLQELEALWDDPECGRRNEKGCSLFDIHLPNYKLPVEGVDKDRKIRQRILDQIEKSRQLDAYFFFEKLARKNSRLPLYLVMVKSNDYDETHNIRDLSIKREEILGHHSTQPALVIGDCADGERSPEDIATIRRSFFRALAQEYNSRMLNQ